jgi:hypothetical protein
MVRSGCLHDLFLAGRNDDFFQFFYRSYSDAMESEYNMAEPGDYYLSGSDNTGKGGNFLVQVAVLYPGCISDSAFYIASVI